MKLIRIIFCLLVAFNLSAQKAQLPLSLELALEEASADALVHLYLKGDHEAIRSEVEAMGGHFKGTFRSYARVVLPAANVLEVVNSSAVDFVHFDHYKGQPLLTASRENTRTDLVHADNANLLQAYTGQGVIIGMIDAGIDLDHPDFQLPNGNTRVIELWDQNLGFDAQKTPTYGYGQVWDSADINAGLCPHTDQASFYGHGTNTTGIAAAYSWYDSNNVFTGHAPGTELIVVSSDFNSFNFTATVADAVDYIFERAEALGRPCVINASLGTYLGSHDGRDISAQIISEKIREQSGRIMVCAAGNAGEQDPFHLGYTATADTNFTWFNSNGNSTIFFEVFGDTGDFEQLNFAIGADRVNSGYQFRGNVGFDNILNRINQVVTDSLFSPSGNYLAKVQTYADSTNGTYRLQYFISNIDSTDYFYRLMCTGGGRLDLWTASWLGYADLVSDNLPSTVQFPEIINYRQPDDLQSIVSSWACSEDVITVGNYTNQNQYSDVDGLTVSFSSLTPGAIAASSSSGPARTGILKPEIAAPGEITLTAGAAFQIASQLSIPSQRNRVGIDTLHNRASGTSSASPVVAGIAALFFEKCNNATAQDFKDALAGGAVVDASTGSVPNHRWGNGKADAINILRYATPNPLVTASQTAFCAGGSAELSLQGSFVNTEWVNGSTQPNITVTQSGLYFALVEDDKGCQGYSDTVSIFSRPIPVKPLVVQEGASPACPDRVVVLSIEDEYGAYEWSSQEFTQSISVTESGDYYCRVSNIHGCENFSDTVSIEFHPFTPLPEITMDVNASLYASVRNHEVANWRWYYGDEEVIDAVDSVLLSQGVGTYQVAYVDSNGCLRRSLPFDAFSVGMNVIDSDFNVYPNPFSESITIESDAPISSYQLLDVSGRIVQSANFAAVSNVAIPTQTLANGVYMLEATTISGKYVIKLTK